MSRETVTDELDLLASLVPLGGRRIVELGCGAAALSRSLVRRHPDARVTAFEVDERQHAKNLAAPEPGITFERGGAQAIPLPDASQDVVLMLKSLHHVPIDAMAQALGEIARVLVPGGVLYVSEPEYAGAFNDVVRMYNDEGVVRAAAQRALDAALAAPDGPWAQAAERRFEMPVSYRDFDDFERRQMHPTYADHRVDDDVRARTRAVFERHCGTDGAHFARLMHVRLLRRRDAAAHAAGTATAAGPVDASARAGDPSRGSRP